MISRRQFLRLSAVAAASLAIPFEWLSSPTSALAFSQSDRLKKFIQPMRVVGAPGGVPVMQPDSTNPGWWQPNVTHYTIEVNQYEDQLHPDLPNPTRLRGFGQNGVNVHLGGIIAAHRDNPVQITFRDNLPLGHILPIDQTIMGVAGNQDNRVDVHLHGGFTPWVTDGGPLDWWDPNGHTGPSFLNNAILNASAAINEAEYYYTNQQGSRLMWYHDHVFGMTRLNAYAGVASGYVIYDDYEADLVKHHNMPGALDPRTFYMVFQDKVFVSKDIDDWDPTWSSIMPNSRPGDLWYPHQYDPARWDVGPGGLPLPAISCIPEFFGDTMLVNGLVYPTLTLEPCQYRFRMLNACQGVFLESPPGVRQGHVVPG